MTPFLHARRSTRDRVEFYLQYDGQREEHASRALRGTDLREIKDARSTRLPQARVFTTLVMTVPT